MVLKKKKKKILDTPQHNGGVEKNFYFLFSKLKLINTPLDGNRQGRP
jgi:hypothetical protein